MKRFAAKNSIDLKPSLMAMALSLMVASPAVVLPVANATDKGPDPQSENAGAGTGADSLRGDESQQLESKSSQPESESERVDSKSRENDSISEQIKTASVKDGFLTNKNESRENSSQWTSTDFALKLFSAETTGNGNVAVSPFSAYAALSMATNGAAGKTRSQMAKVLGVTSDTIEQLNERNHTVIAALANSKSVQLEIGNAIYSDVSTALRSSFIDTCKKVYSAGAENIEFRKPSAVSIINSWCNQKTHSKIPAIIDRLNPETKSIILSAVYFKGKWANCFDQAATTDDTFTTLKGVKAPVKMMHQHDNLDYLKGSDSQAVSIPYQGRKQSMLIFLPNKGVNFGRFRTELTSAMWNKSLTLFKRAPVNLRLPRFKARFSADLAGTLATMGMPDAFSDSADFSNMVTSTQGVRISKVLQKTFIEVQEEGTEAAATTEVETAPRDLFYDKPAPVEFRVDRPFVLALVDNDTKEILFLGSIVEP